jgi:hypothetical protein
MALIVSELGKSTEARQHARIALEEAAQEYSGFRYHPRVGLVGDEHEELRRQLARIASEGS